jgi:hypothetical protein
VAGTVSILIFMNAPISKLESADVDESMQPQSDASANGLSGLPESGGEVPSDDNAERQLYRRTFAYFLFGSGYDKNAIVTDDP